MKDEIKQIAESVASHPKATMVITAAFTSNAWLDYGEPIVKGVTSIVGLCVLVALLVKHILDIKHSLNDDKSQNKQG